MDHFSYKKVGIIDGTEIELSAMDQALWIPNLFLADPKAVNAYKMALQFLSTAGPDVLKNQWIIGSTNLDIFGNKRTSVSHSSWKAIDIAPMFSDESITSPLKTSPALAWDVVKLAALSTITWSETLWVVEGDHIHLELEAPPHMPASIAELRRAKTVFSVPTLASWYPVKVPIDSLSVLKSRFWGVMFQFSPSDMVFRPAETSLVMDYLKASRNVTLG